MGANKSQNEAKTVLGTSLIGLARTVDGELAAAHSLARIRAEERDDARAEVERLRAEVERLRAQAVPEWAASAPLDEVRAWLDGRGRRSVAHYLDVGWEANLWGDRGTRIARARAETEEAALRALAAQVAGGDGLVRIFPASQEMVPASALAAAQSEAATLRRALRQVARELANDRAASGEGAWASEAAVQAIIEAALAAANEEETPDAPDTP